MNSKENWKAGQKEATPVYPRAAWKKKKVSPHGLFFLCLPGKSTTGLSSVKCAKSLRDPKVMHKKCCQNLLKCIKMTYDCSACPEICGSSARIDAPNAGLRRVRARRALPTEFRFTSETILVGTGKNGSLSFSLLSPPIEVGEVRE